MSFRLVPKSVTLNDLERRSGRYCRYFSEIGSIKSVQWAYRRWPVHVRCLRKKLTFAISSPDEFLSVSLQSGLPSDSYCVMK